MTRTSATTATGLLVVSIVAVAGVGLLVHDRAPEGEVSPVTADAVPITDVIRAANIAFAAACTAASPEELETATSELSDYWSNTAPSGSRLATREARYRKSYPTSRPEDGARNSESVIASHTAGKITTDTLNSWLAYQYPTPSFDPMHTPLDESLQRISTCRRDGSLLARTYWRVEVTSLIQQQDVVVARVDLGVEESAKDGIGATQSYSFTMPYEYDLVYVEGEWKIQDQRYVGERPIP